jgi:uncharacterized membrane protein SpoIIM required for sporulation
VTLEDFIGSRSGAWNELRALVDKAGRRPQRLGADGVLRLGELYRAAAADLAFARRRFPRDPATISLERLVGRARHLVYQAPARREAVLDWVRRGYWQSVATRKRELAIAALITFGVAALAAVWAYRDPGAAGGLVPGAYDSVTRPRPHGANLGLPLSTRTEFATEIFTNNIRVTFLAFAAGVLVGVGTAILLLYNGIVLGTVGGLAAGSGNGRVFFELVTAHGLLELSCIVVCGAAGMRMGWAVVEPGRRTRPQALGDEARDAIKVVLGTAPWLVVAGLIEGFLTPAGLGLPAVLGIGIAAAGTYWTLVLLLGVRRPREPLP